MNISILKDLTGSQKKALAITLGIALLLKNIPVFYGIFQAYNIAVHEVGHALMAWFFGYIAIPRFDIVNGGGVTHLIARPFLLSLGAFIFVFANLMLIKKHIHSLANIKIGFALLFYCIFFFSPLHRQLITFMGLGGEIILSFMIAWNALSNLKFKIGIKYTLHLFLSIAIIQHTTNYLFSLLFDPQTKLKYIEGKQDMFNNNPLTNDLVKLTESTGLSFNFFTWFLLILTALSLYYILRINKLPTLPKRLFKTYFVSLYKSLKNLRNQLPKP